MVGATLELYISIYLTNLPLHYITVPYCLAVTPCSLLRPPPIFGRNYCKGLFYLHYTPPPPPRAARAGLPYCSSARVRVLQV